jgi:ATP-dependent Clp protease adaptor protein ClpS
LYIERKRNVKLYSKDKKQALNVAQLLFLLQYFILHLLYKIIVTMSSIKFLEDNDTLTLTTASCALIVWNDDVNTFEWVIETLKVICGHSSEQAEQCAIIIDSKGKYAVKQGSYDELKPMCDAITERLINATVEVIAG